MLFEELFAVSFRESYETRKYMVRALKALSHRVTVFFRVTTRVLVSSYVMDHMI
jgi:hypothetical protein